MWSVLLPLVSLSALLTYAALPILWTRSYLHIWVKLAASLLLLARIGFGVMQGITSNSVDSYDRLMVELAAYSTVHIAILLMLVSLSLVPRRATC